MFNYAIVLALRIQNFVYFVVEAWSIHVSWLRCTKFRLNKPPSCYSDY